MNREGDMLMKYITAVHDRMTHTSTTTHTHTYSHISVQLFSIVMAPEQGHS